MNIYKIKNENRINCKGIVELPEKGTYRALLYRNWSPLQLFDNLHLVEERYLLAPMIAFLSPTSSGSIPYVELTFSITCKVFFFGMEGLLYTHCCFRFQLSNTTETTCNKEARTKEKEKYSSMEERDERKKMVEGERREDECIN